MWLVAVLGCEAEPFAGAFLGELPGTEARIAVGVEAPDVRVYVAGAGETLATHTRWFRGTLDAEDRFEDEVDGWTITGWIEGDALFGELVDPEGGLTPWHVSPTLPGTLDGPWAGPETGAGSCQPGAVVYNSVFQVQGGFCPAAGEIVPVSAVDLDAADGVIELQGEVEGAPVPFEATPAFPLPASEEGR